MSDSLEQNYNNVMSKNNSYVNSSALQTRLDTTGLLQKLELYLQGYHVKYIQTEKGVEEKIVKLSEPLANEMGVQRILARFSTLFNSHMAQGNVSETRYEFFLERVHKDLAISILLNRTAWGIKSEEASYIMSLFMNPLQLFASRTINDGERRSLTESVKVMESSQVREQSGSGFQLFSFGKK